MVINESPAWDQFEQTYDDAIVYGDRAGEEVLHRGSVRIRANGWVELPTDRLLSPEAVHHIDKQD